MHPLRLVAYYTGWSIYARQFFPEQMPFDKITHVNYAFGRVKTDGTVYMDANEVAFTFPHERKDLELLGGALYQLFSLKTQHRRTKVLLSIGGWSERDHWRPALATPESRSKFINSSVHILEDFGFDGLDIDYEFPETESDGVAMEILIKDLRKELDDRAKANGYPPGTRFLLTMASPAYVFKLRKFRFNEVTPYLDFINVMGYDLAGPWDTTVQHMSRLYGKPISVSTGIEGHIQLSVPQDKIVLGVPLYGRTYAGVEEDGSPYSGSLSFTTPGRGSYERGVMDYHDVMNLPCNKTFNKEFGATHCYDRQKKEMICFDDTQSVAEKINYIDKESLGGMMFWEASGDSTDSSLIQQFASASGNRLENSENCVVYPHSKFFNIRSKPYNRLAESPDASNNLPRLTKTSHYNPVPSNTSTDTSHEPNMTGAEPIGSNLAIKPKPTKIVSKGPPLTTELRPVKTKSRTTNRRKFKKNKKRPVLTTATTTTNRMSKASKTSSFKSKQTSLPSHSSQYSRTNKPTTSSRRRVKAKHRKVCTCKENS